MLKSGARERPV